MKHKKKLQFPSSLSPRTVLGSIEVSYLFIIICILITKNTALSVLINVSSKYKLALLRMYSGAEIKYSFWESIPRSKKTFHKRSQCYPVASEERNTRISQVKSTNVISLADHASRRACDMTLFSHPLCVLYHFPFFLDSPPCSIRLIETDRTAYPSRLPISITHYDAWNGKQAR